MADPKDLELLILSRYAIIAVETYEEERVEATVQAVATKLQIPFFVWTLTEGLRRRGAESPIYDTQRPIMALANLASIKGDGVYLFKDLHRHLGDPEVVRKLQDLARPFGQARRAIVLSAPRIELPPELEKLAACFRLELPTRDELARLAADVVAQLGRQHRIRMELTLYEAERALTRVVLDDLALTLRDLDRIVEMKKGLLEKVGILEYVPAEEGLAQVGGLANLKAWLAKRQKAFTIEAARFGVSPPKGILLLGVQGSGKTLAAKAVAREWGLPLLRLEPGRLYTAFSRSSELATGLIVEELRATKPLSVTRAEEVQGLRDWARDRTVPAS